MFIGLKKKITYKYFLIQIRNKVGSLTLDKRHALQTLLHRQQNILFNIKFDVIMVD